MIHIPRAIVSHLAAGMMLLSAAPAFGQGALLQGGPWTPGHAPMYVGSGSGQAIVQDSGPASGGPLGVGLSELGVTARGTGAPPYAGQGTGPFGTNICDYDAPINSATGYHFLCMSPNTQGGGLIAYGSSGIAAPLPLCFIINGLPLCIGGTSGGGVVTATLPTTPAAVTCWVDAAGKLGNCAAPSATLFGNPGGGSGIPAPFTIQGLPARGAPDATNDKIPVYDFASGTIKYVTPGLIAASATAGVSSFGGVTGAITLSSSFAMAGQSLTLTSVGCALVNFTQSGTGAVAITCDQLLRGAMVTPEMFGGNCDGTDAGPGIQRAINYAGPLRATITPKPCHYTIITPIIDPFGVWIRGSGPGDGVTPGTFFDFAPASANQILYRVRNAGSIVTGGGIANVFFFSSDTTKTKTAIEIEDVSDYQINNVVILGGVGAWTGGGNSIGLRVRGREFVRVNIFHANADRPIVISDNPNSTIDNDFGDYDHLYLLPTGIGKAFEIEDGVNFTHMSISNIACVLGAHCVYQLDTTTSQISQGLSIRNLGTEQGTSGAGSSVFLSRNSPIFGLDIDGFQVWDPARGGIKLRNITGVNLQNAQYVGAGQCIDADNSVFSLSLTNVTFQNCLITNFTGQIFIRGNGIPSGYVLPTSAGYESVNNGASLNWAAYTVTPSCNAGTLSTGNSFTGAYKIVDGKTYVVRIQANIGAAGVGTCSQLFVTLPAAASSAQVFAGKDATTNKMISGLTAGASTSMLLQDYLGGNVAANNLTASISGTYEIQ